MERIVRLRRASLRLVALTTAFVALSAIDANVSMITLIHRSCKIVNGGRMLKNGPRSAIARALTLIVNWNCRKRWMFSILAPRQP